jgi:O-methyltransferase
MMKNGNVVDLSTLRARYLDLIRDSLIGLIHEDPSYECRPGGGELAYDRGKRVEGQDWPRRAVSMIGERRMTQLQRAVEDVLARGVPGDLIETGVWRGGACILMRAVLMAYGVRDRRVWVADSFEGLPAPDPARYPADRGIAFHTFEQLAVPLDEVRRNFDRYRLLDEQVVFLKGWFRDTLKDAPIARLAVLRLDGDLYESTMDALAALYDKVSPGGYVIVDDYGGIAACASAVTDFRRARGIAAPIRRIDATGVYWIKAG